MWNVPLHVQVLEWIAYMSTESYIQKRCETLRIVSFFIRGHAKIHIQEQSLVNKEGI
jgi:hypothetical protein